MIVLLNSIIISLKRFKILVLRGKVVENDKFVPIYIVYVFNNTEGLTELRILADSIEQRSGWVLAFYNDKMVCGVKEEHLKAFYLEVDK